MLREYSNRNYLKEYKIEKEVYGNQVTKILGVKEFKFVTKGKWTPKDNNGRWSVVTLYPLDGLFALEPPIQPSCLI